MSITSLRPDVLALVGALAGITAPATAATANGGQSAPPADAAAARTGGSATEPVAVPPAIACTLGTAERRARREAIVRDLLPRVRAVTEIENGYVLWFDHGDGELSRIASFVDLESRCCAFLDFAIRLESGGARIALELGGPAGTKEFLRPLIESTPTTGEDPHLE